MLDASSSQGRVVVLIHLQILLLLLVANWLGRRTVLIVIIVLGFKLVASLVSSETTAATASSTGATCATTSIATSSTTSTTTSWLFFLLIGSHFLVKRLILFLGFLFHFLDLLLQLGTAVFTEPSLFLLNLANTIVKVVISDWCWNAQQGEFLNNDEVKLESLLVLHLFLLLLSFLFSWATERN